MESGVPVVKDLVLVGGGHSHVAVLKRFGMRPLPGVRLTLIAKDVHTPYSGMLPGFVAGRYDLDDCHIDLRPLARFAGARLYHDEAVGLDAAARMVHCRGRPPVPYDLLSIDIGSTPRADEVPGAQAHAVPVKPIAQLVERWQALIARVMAQSGTARIAVVGGGAGGVELALAVDHRLRSLAAAEGRGPERIEVHLIAQTPDLLPTYPPRIQAIFARLYRERGITPHLGSPVVMVEPNRLHLGNGGSIDADEILWVTQAAAAGWPGEAGLATGDGGFILVDETLRSISHPDIFAAGDVATMVGHDRPKAGVFAVRQGPPLAGNLRRALLGRRLRRHVPQRHFLSLIGTGDGRAVASRNGLAAEGRWVWRLKDWIDRRWMRRYTELPEMAGRPAPAAPAPGLAGPEALSALSALALRCGGCGAKVGATVLTRVLGGLVPLSRPDVLVGLDAPDDAAVVAVPPGKVAVHTVDHFRAFIDDPYLFGRIAANHALSDIYAMGAEPQSALAIATLPYGLEDKTEALLRDLMAGALATLAEHDTALAGGHTSEGAELALGFAVTGLAAPETLLRKGGMRPGDVVILTKPIGTGVLFAADMRGRARGRCIDAALASMLRSNRDAAQCLRRHGARACTDVSGFGLLGHLVEMVRASPVDVALDLDAVPLLDGARETVAAGIFSSLQADNARARRALRDLGPFVGDDRLALLFDPQTAGGLLAAVPAGAAADCVKALRAGGDASAAAIGIVAASVDADQPIRLVRGAAMLHCATAAAAG